VLLSRIWIPVLAVLLLVIGLSAGILDDRVVPANEVLAKIKAGEPAEFDNCIIVGDLDLSALKIKGPVHFNRTIFRNSANFEYTTFSDAASFEGSEFNNIVDFRGSSFNSHADFQNSSFNDSASFAASTFNSTADFQASAFRSPVDFRGTSFNSYANFGYETFDKDASFLDSSFNGPASFKSTAFKGNAYFVDSAFNSTAGFMNSDFNGSASFENTKFGKWADFSNVRFNQDVSFNSSRFYGDAIFENANFSRILYLTRTRYDNLYIRWTDIRELGYDESSYLSLVDNFKRLGLFDDANDCYNQYKALSGKGNLDPIIPISILIGIASMGAVLVLSYKAYKRKIIVADFKNSLDRISRAEPRDVQEIAASQITLLGSYYEIALEQAQKSFIAAFVAAIIGLIFFLVSAVFLVLNDQIKLAMIGGFAAAITEVISGINFYLYDKSASQLIEFLNNLNMTQRFLLANSICEGLEGDFKQQARSDLVRAIAGASDLDKKKI
jgi:hypothetical protein